MIRDIINGTLTTTSSDTVVSHDDDYDMIPPDAQVDLQLVGLTKNLGLLKVSCSDDDSTKHHPTTIVCVLDVSYSMDGRATMHGDEEGRSGLSLLDIVKHATKTVIESLSSHDSLGIVTYSTSSEIILPVKKMSHKNKEEACRLVNSLCTTGSTNLWAGLKSAMDIIVSSKVDDNSSILLLTDGLPNIEPPRGHIPALKHYLDKHPTFKSSINTFGFGYSLDTELLDSLAKEGMGQFGFIPDASFVGTAFVNLVANLLSNAGKPSTLNIEATMPEVTTLKSCRNFPFSKTPDGDCLTVTLPYLRYGQSFFLLIEFDSANVSSDCGEERNLPINAVLNANCFGKNSSEYLEMKSTFVNDEALIKLCEARSELIELSSKHSTKMLLGEKYNRAAANEVEDTLARASEDLRHLLAKWSMNNEDNSDDLDAILKDFSGQVTEAFSRRDWYMKWGVHYIPSLCRAHELQQCTNFKDPGVQIYASKKFSAIRDACDDLFVSLPPPKPSISTYNYGSGVNSTAVVSMRAYHNSNAPCFASGLVLLANGEKKDVSKITKGDFIHSSKGPAMVKCVVKTKCEGGTASLVELADNVLVTPWHPVRKNLLDSWSFPSDLMSPKLRPCNQVYSFILENCVEDMMIGSYYAVTLGHGINDPVASHEFLGTSKVIDDISKKVGFERGLVTLDSNPAIRDPITGLIIGFKNNKIKTTLFENPFQELQENHHRKTRIGPVV